MDLKIITDHKWHDFLYVYELTDKEQTEHADTINSDDTLNCFRYRGQVYFLEEFMRLENNDELENWHGYASDTFFSGVLIRISEDGERYQVGRYYS